MYVKSFLENENGKAVPIVSFGPVSVLPEYQRKGIGSQLIQTTMTKVESLGYPAIVIWGNPGNYVKYGFKNCKDFNISVSDENYPTCLLVHVFDKQALGNGLLLYKESDVYNLDNDKVEEYDRLFEKKEKKYQYSQELFRILSHSKIS
jgi:predicted acetyltransferase